MVTGPNKASDVVISEKEFHEEKILKLIIDVNKFKKLNEDLTLTREGQLQRFLRKIKEKGLFDDNTYKKIYPSGSKPAAFNSLPESRKFLSNGFQDLFYRSIVSSIAAYNYNLAKFLLELLEPVIPKEHCANESFTFCGEIPGVSANDYFLVSYDLGRHATSDNSRGLSGNF